MSAEAHQRLKVFVSTAVPDGGDVRQAVVEAVEAAGHLAIGGPNPATSGGNLEAVLHDCDVFLLVLGSTLSGVDPPPANSYQRLEYKYAVKKEKPILAFVKDTDFGPGEREEFQTVDEFENWILDHHDVTIWVDLNSLRHQVISSLAAAAAIDLARKFVPVGRSAESLTVLFDAAPVSPEDMQDLVAALDDLYQAMGGSGLEVVEGESIHFSTAKVPVA